MRPGDAWLQPAWNCCSAWVCQPCGSSPSGGSAAQETLWQVLRVVAEPGGAAAFAALLSGRYRPQAGERVGVLVCGGNTVAVDFSR